MACAAGGCGALDKNSATGQEEGASSLVCRHSSLNTQHDTVSLWQASVVFKTIWLSNLPLELCKMVTVVTHIVCYLGNFNIKKWKGLRCEVLCVCSCDLLCVYSVYGSVILGYKMRVSPRNSIFIYLFLAWTGPTETITCVKRGMLCQ